MCSYLYFAAFACLVPLLFNLASSTHDLADCVWFIFSQVWSSRYYIFNIIKQSIIVAIMKYLAMQIFVELIFCGILISSNIAQRLTYIKYRISLDIATSLEDKFNKQNLFEISTYIHGIVQLLVIHCVCLPCAFVCSTLHRQLWSTDCVSFIFSQVWSSRYYIVNIIQQSIIVPIMKCMAMQLRWVDLLWDPHIFKPCATVDLYKIAACVRHCNLPEDMFNKRTFTWN